MPQTEADSQELAPYDRAIDAYDAALTHVAACRRLFRQQAATFSSCDTPLVADRLILQVIQAALNLQAARQATDAAWDTVQEIQEQSAAQQHQSPPISTIAALAH